MNRILSTTSTFSDVEKTLLLKQQQVEEQLKALELSDPIFLDMAPESGEFGTDSWQADVHARCEVLKGSLLMLYSKIKYSLNRVKNGTYGQCDKCFKEIESERLKVLPTATLCAVCVNLTKSF